MNLLTYNFVGDARILNLSHCKVPIGSRYLNTFAHNYPLSVAAANSAKYYLCTYDTGIEHI